MQYRVVLPGLVPGIHVLPARGTGVDGRVKPGQDERGISQSGSALTIEFLFGGGPPAPAGDCWASS